MKSKYSIIIFIIFVIALAACNGLKKEISLDLKATNVPEIAIEGYFTNETKAHTIKINRVPSYTSSETPAPAEGAIVTITSGLSNYTLNETSPGTYQTLADVAGEIGKSYTLNITYNNKMYTAVSKLLPPLVIDTLYTTKIQDKKDEYYLYMSSKSEITQDQNFIIKTFVNQDSYDTLENWVDYSAYFNSSLKLNNIIIGEIGGYGTGAVAEINCLTVEKGFIDFVSAAKEANIPFNAMTPFFSPTPSNIPTNLSDGAIGYFLAAAIETKRCIVK